MSTLLNTWFTIQKTLFPWLEAEFDPLTVKQRQFVEVVSLMAIESHMAPLRWRGIGRMPKSRKKIMKAFIAKAVYGLPTTEALVEHIRDSKNIRRLCGWESVHEIPSLSTFSRAFGQIARTNVLQEIHEAMIKNHYGAKIAGHVSRDSTAIEAREKPIKKAKSAPAPKRKPGRPKGSKTDPFKKKRLKIQPRRNLEENLRDLPRHCGVGSKFNSKRHLSHWVGYKLHLDCIDGDIPVSAILTTASLHDSQVAIPLTQMTAKRVTSLYDLMDAAYDAKQIREYSWQMGHVPIIENNPRHDQKQPFTALEKARFANRTSVERVYSNLKDNHGGRDVRVRGWQKVMAHLMFGVLIITATQLTRLIL